MTAASGGERAEQGRRLLDEAVRLLDAVQSRPSAPAGDAPTAHGDDCRWCPVCRGVAALRELDPDAVTRVATAVADLAGAVRDLLSGPSSGSAPGSPSDAPPEPAPANPGAHGEGPPPVQRIVVGE